TGRHLFPFLRNRVVTKFAREWMAAEQPLQPKPNSARHAKSFNGHVGITRTRGLKAATAREQDRQIRFVELQSDESRAPSDGSIFALWPCGGRSALLVSVHGNQGHTQVRRYRPFSRRSKSVVSAKNGARAVVLFG